MDVEDVRYRQAETAGSCFECGMPSSCAHHVIPKSRGGVRTIELCGFCHAKAHHRNGNMDLSVLTKQALDARRKKGQIIGQIPYGYQLGANGILIEVPEEIATVINIHQLRSAGLTLREIARELDSQSIPTKKGIINKFTKPNKNGKVYRLGGGRWSHKTVKNVLAAEKRWCTSSLWKIIKRTQERPLIKQRLFDFCKHLTTTRTEG